ncbi:MAG: aminopeptidase P family protein [Trueperaceae bacterium]|nr:aminopeptidase P family protein [Trueperaceae bacterium]
MTKLEQLREVMRQHKLDAYLIPSSDPHQSEYVAEHWQVRAWLSGFTGSAGTVVVTQTKAGLWTDARYYIRAAEALKGSSIHLFKAAAPGVPDYADWLLEQLEEGASLGFDAAVVSAAEVTRLENVLSAKRITLCGKHDLFARIWPDRPPPPAGQIEAHEEMFAGESRLQKLERIRQGLKQKGAEAHFLAALDDIAWTFNLRGQDVPFNPVFLSFAFISQKEAWLFLCGSLDSVLRSELNEQGIKIARSNDLESFLVEIAPTTVYFDPEKTSSKITTLLAKRCQLVAGSSLPYTLKAIKNMGECASHRRAQLRDSVALVRWWMWLEEAIASSQQTEITVAQKLDAFRAQGDYFREPSFSTIVGYGANSAVGHYKAYPETTPTLKAEGILLVDSGGQYLDGTTDITRTFSLGKVSPWQKQVFTTVLKSLICLSRLEFPQGTKGDQLDAIAREPLWQRGWECRHGIGHGVGHYLNVHEGPQRFSKTNDVVFQPGMLSSNEPGVYFEGEFGVRLENLLLCEIRQTSDFAQFLGFETMTFFPFDLSLLAPELLTLSEIEWLNDYHARVLTALTPLLLPAEQKWLEAKTRPLGRPV